MRIGSVEPSIGDELGSFNICGEHRNGFTHDVTMRYTGKIPERYLILCAVADKSGLRSHYNLRCRSFNVGGLWYCGTVNGSTHTPHR